MPNFKMLFSPKIDILLMAISLSLTDLHPIMKILMKPLINSLTVWPLSESFRNRSSGLKSSFPHANNDLLWVAIALDDWSAFVAHVSHIVDLLVAICNNRNFNMVKEVRFKSLCNKELIKFSKKSPLNFIH